MRQRSAVFLVSWRRLGPALSQRSSPRNQPRPDPRPAPNPFQILLHPKRARHSPLSLLKKSRSADEQSVGIVSGKSSTGTGFVVRPRLLATNFHVISSDNVEDLRVTFPSAPIQHRGPLRVELVYEDPRRDLALLSSPTTLPPLEIAAADSFTKGQEITLIGNPGSLGGVILPNAISRGVMSTRTYLDGMEYLQLSISANHGNSGGPAFNPFGHVVGVVTRKDPQGESMTFCIPPSDLRSAIDRSQTRFNDHSMNESFHNAKIIYGSMIRLAIAYSSVLIKEVAGMDQALSMRLDPNLGIIVVRRNADEGLRVIDSHLDRTLYPRLRNLADDDRIMPSVRTDLVAVWNICLEMKRDIDSPSGTPESYRYRVSRYHERLTTLVDTLQATLWDRVLP